MEIKNVPLTRRRVDWIDATKGFAIILVVLGHMSYFLPITIKVAIYSFHMPLFFFLSGFFLFHEHERFRVFLLKKIKTLIFPYICFSLFWIFVNYLWGILDVQLSSDISYKGILFGMYTPLWFLLCLFCTQVLLYPFLGNGKVIIKGIIFLLLIGLMYNYFIYMKLKPYLLMLPLHLDTAFIVSFFVAVGFLCRDYLKNNDIPNWLFFLSLFLYPICTVLNYNFTGRSVEIYENFVGNYFYFFFASFSGIIIVLKCLKTSFGLSKILIFLGNNSLCVYALHKFLQIPIQFSLLFCFKLLGLSQDNMCIMFLFSLGSTAVILLLLKPVIDAINIKFSWILGRF